MMVQKNCYSESGGGGGARAPPCTCLRVPMLNASGSGWNLFFEQWWTPSIQRFWRRTQFIFWFTFLLNG